MSSGKSRLDVALVERGFFDSREKARRAIMAARILLDGQPSTKPGTLIPADARLEVIAKEKYVGRGGYKLEAALDAFRVDPAGRICADFGASTGGFTDCLLQRGATRVFAIDVGHGQLAWSLRQDPRVEVREGVNVRHLKAGEIDPAPSLAVADVSFISLTLIFPAIFALLPPESDMVVLIKPQFELSKSEVGRGGIVREESLRLRAVEKIRASVEGFGHRWLAAIPSPITGRDGNVEYLAHIRP
ncbi:MAG: TlyA family RNA methyltransferase [Chthoniobacterales bacterium]|nr:TlyA family RNA methyltransferase [Chthoniobacterales bacterium]